MSEIQKFKPEQQKQHNVKYWCKNGHAYHRQPDVFKCTNCGTRNIYKQEVQS